jgi:hypothetical protein
LEWKRQEYIGVGVGGTGAYIGSREVERWEVCMYGSGGGDLEYRCLDTIQGSRSDWGGGVESDAACIAE